MRNLIILSLLCAGLFLLVNGINGLAGSDDKEVAVSIIQDLEEKNKTLNSDIALLEADYYSALFSYQRLKDEVSEGPSVVSWPDTIVEKEYTFVYDESIMAYRYQK